MPSLSHAYGAAVLALTVAACSACAATAPREADTTALHDLYGFITWSCDRPEPQWFISRLAHADAVTLRSTIAHEESHRALMMALGCEVYQEWRKDVTSRVVIEALAFCASAREMVTSGVPADQALARVSRQMTHPSYGFNLAPDEAAALIVAVCP